MRERILRFVLLSALGVVALACVPQVAIRFYTPARVNLGATETISIVQTEGRRSAREEVVAEFMARVRSGGHYQVQDRSEEGIDVDVAGLSATVTGDATGGAENELYMRIDVLEWEYDQDSMMKKYKKKDGSTGEKIIIVSSGRVVLAVTICRPEGGQTLIAENEYVGGFTTEEEGWSEASVMRLAAQDVVGSLVGDISPQPKKEYVTIDDSDEALQGVIVMMEEGQYAEASMWLVQYTTQNPQSAGAWYNLALVTDAMGDYATALQYYDTAIQLGGVDFYYEARAGCAARLTQSQALTIQY